MAEISFKRGYQVEPAPVKALATGSKTKDGRTVCVVCEGDRFWVDTAKCGVCNPRCDRLGCGSAGPHLPHEQDEVATMIKIPPPPGKRLEKTCPLCAFVSERYGSTPTFCVACDSPFELPKDPPVHCGICNLKAPYVIGRVLAPMAHHKGLVPDTDGWARNFFPWPDAKAREGAMVWPESIWLCPADAKKVAEFIAHLKQPMRTEYENL